MSTNRQIISDIVSALRAQNIDDRISFRLVLSLMRDSTGNFVKQDADNRRLFKESSLWLTIPCVAMESVNVNECNADLLGCETIQKSIVRIPETYNTMYGDSIRVLNLAGSIEYKQIQPQDYQDIKNRPFKSQKFKYFWIDNNHIYIPDSQVEDVKVIGYFKKSEYVARLLNRDGGCMHPLDEEFRCPTYLVKIVKDDVFQTLLRTFKSVVVDENPDLDSNAKTPRR